MIYILLIPVAIFLGIAIGFAIAMERALPAFPELWREYQLRRLKYAHDPENPALLIEWWKYPEPIRTYGKISNPCFLVACAFLLIFIIAAGLTHPGCPSGDCKWIPA